MPTADTPAAEDSALVSSSTAAPSSVGRAGPAGHPGSARSTPRPGRRRPGAARPRARRPRRPARRAGRPARPAATAEVASTGTVPSPSAASSRRTSASAASTWCGGSRSTWFSTTTITPACPASGRRYRSCTAASAYFCGSSTHTSTSTRSTSRSTSIRCATVVESWSGRSSSTSPSNRWSPSSGCGGEVEVVPARDLQPVQQRPGALRRPRSPRARRRWSAGAPRPWTAATRSAR